MQIEGVIKPMPDYEVHYRAGIEIRRDGLNFVVDDAAKEAFKLDDKKKLLTMSPDGYKYMREGNGKFIVIEPRGGLGDSAMVTEELVSLRAAHDDAQEQIAEMRRSFAEERKAYQTRIAELEAAFNKKK